MVLACVIHPINPRLAIWLGSLYRSDVMRLAVIVPSQNLDDVHLIPYGNERLPAF